MTKTLTQRFKEWICKLVGHKFTYSHTFNKKDHYWCDRCGKGASK